MEAGQTLWRVHREYNGTLRVASVTVKRVTSQSVWLQEAGFAFGFRTRLERSVAEREATTKANALTDYVNECSEKLSQAESDLAAAVKFKESQS